MKNGDGIYTTVILLTSTCLPPSAPGHLCCAQLPEPATLRPKVLPLGGPEPTSHHGQPPRKVKCGPGKGGRGQLPAGEGGGWKGTKETRSQARGGCVSGPWGCGGMTHLCGHKTWGIVHRREGCTPSLPAKGTWLILRIWLSFLLGFLPNEPLMLWPVGPRGPLALSFCLFISGTRGLQAAFDTGTAHPIQ